MCIVYAQILYTSKLYRAHCTCIVPVCLSTSCFDHSRYRQLCCFIHKLLLKSCFSHPQRALSHPQRALTTSSASRSFTAVRFRQQPCFDRSQANYRGRGRDLPPCKHDIKSPVPVSYLPLPCVLCAVPVCLHRSLARRQRYREGKKKATTTDETTKAKSEIVCA